MTAHQVHGGGAAFTLAEVIVASALVVLMVGLLLTVMDQTTRIWSGASAKVEQFRDARNAFERVSTRLAQATLNTYWDYDSPTIPTRYLRRSELRFISGIAQTMLGNGAASARVTHAVFFNAPMGVTATQGYGVFTNALNTAGYFVELADDTGQRPAFVTSAMIPPVWRFRLMEFVQPTENFSLYQFTSGMTGSVPNSASYSGSEWYKTDANKAATSQIVRRTVAENVIAFIVTPRLAKAEELPLQTNATHSPLAPFYAYDSTSISADPRINPRNQLPPLLQITMVAIDDKSAAKLNLSSIAQADVFKVSNLFTDTRNFTSDLGTLEDTLAASRMRYRIFTTNVHIRAAKWSQEQAN